MPRASAEHVVVVVVVVVVVLSVIREKEDRRSLNALHRTRGMIAGWPLAFSAVLLFVAHGTESRLDVVAVWKMACACVSGVTHGTARSSYEE